MPKAITCGSLITGRVVEWNEDGSPRRMIGAFSDITARKQAEELLRLQTDVIRNMQEGVNLVDAGGRIIFANPACDAMFGYAAGESIGLHISTFNAGSGEDAPAHGGAHSGCAQRKCVLDG